MIGKTKLLIEIESKKNKLISKRLFITKLKSIEREVVNIKKDEKNVRSNNKVGWQDIFESHRSWKMRSSLSP